NERRASGPVTGLVDDRGGEESGGEDIALPADSLALSGLSEPLVLDPDGAAAEIAVGGRFENVVFADRVRRGALFTGLAVDADATAAHGVGDVVLDPHSRDLADGPEDRGLQPWRDQRLLLQVETEHTERARIRMLA